jgi:hypothetical protein
MLTALMPAVERSSTSWTAVALAVEGVFALALFGVRARWRTRLFLVWETSVQSTILRSLMPAPAPVHVMPVAAAFDLREAA